MNALLDPRVKTACRKMTHINDISFRKKIAVKCEAQTI